MSDPFSHSRETFLSICYDVLRSYSMTGPRGQGNVGQYAVWPTVGWIPLEFNVSRLTP